MSEKKMVKKTIENRKHSSFMQAYPDLQYIKDAGFEVELTAIEPEPGGYGENIGDYWNIHIFKWVPRIVISKEVVDKLKEVAEERGMDFDAGLEILEVEDEPSAPKPFTSGGYINAKALTELKADEQVINFEKIKEEALHQYGKELEKDVAELAKETHEKFFKEERDAFIKSLEPAKPSDSYGWDFDKINELREKQDKERLEREGERKRRKERDLNGLIKTFDEVFWFIRKYNTKGIEEMKKHNDLYVRIRDELVKAHEEKYSDFRKKE